MGGKSQEIVIGYKYYLGVQVILTQGEVDAVTKVVIGEREAYSGNLTVPSSIYINKPELFGGDKREGGVVGVVAFTSGQTSTQDSYLVSILGPNVPAYIGLTTAIFKSFQWSSINPYFKAPWFQIRRILKGWRQNNVWYSAKAVINTLDMNPAHIVYQCLTDDKWGMGYSPSDVDDASFTAAADKLYTEGFGLSLVWNQQTTIEGFIQFILDHINGTLRLSLSTGKFGLKLIRDDYVVGSLTEVTPSNCELSSFQRAGWGELANELTVTYMDRDQNEASFTVQDLAAIDAQGAIVTSTKSYPGIRTQELAMRVAMRDLNTSSSTLAKITLMANRVLYSHEVGDVIALTWPDLGITQAPFRIVNIDKGTLTDGRIKVEAVEDQFGLPNNAYTGTQGSGFVEPSQPAVPVVTPIVVEAPYWDIVRRLPSSDFNALTPDYAFGEATAAVPNQLNYGFELWESATTSNYEFAASGYFAPVATTTMAADFTTSVITVNDIRGLTDVAIGSYAIYDGEYVEVQAVDLALGTVTLGRGVLDTIPAKHASGIRIYFAEGNLAYDPTQYTTGITEHYKLLMKTPISTSTLLSAVDLPITFTGRAHKPYPPADLKINGVRYPEFISGNITATWVTRNRLTQTVELIPYDQPTISAETGQSTTIVFKNEANVPITSLTTSALTFTMTREVEIANSNVVSAPGNTPMRTVGVSARTDALSAALREGTGVYAYRARTGFGKVNGGYLYPGGVYVDTATNTRTNISGFWNATAAPQPTPWDIKYGVMEWFDPFAEWDRIALFYPPYTGPQTFWIDSDDNPGVVRQLSSSSYVHVLDALDRRFTFRDRRTNPLHVLVKGQTMNYFLFSVLTNDDIKYVRHFDLVLTKVNVADMIANNHTTTKTSVLDMNYARANEFDSVSGTQGFGSVASDLWDFKRDELDVIFGNMVYLHFTKPAGSTVSTSGKTVDITNVLNAHINFYNNTTAQITCRRYTINATTGALTFLDDRSQTYLADVLDTANSFGFEINESTRAVTKINMLTGASAGSLGTISQTPVAVLGDGANAYMYVLDSTNVLSKYDATLTLLASVTVPAMPGLKYLSESAGYIYIQAENVGSESSQMYRCLKTLTDLRPVIGWARQGTYFSDPGSTTLLTSSTKDRPYTFAAYGQADEDGIDSSAFNSPEPRVNATVYVEASSTRAGVVSLQKHSISVKRSGYGLRYGRYS